MMIEKVSPLSGARLQVVLSDGRSGVFDVQPYLDCEVFLPLREPEEFGKLRNGGYFIEWECGADLSLDTIEAQLK